ncbi:hypothetical protein QVD17_11966 [Tagetes erecta]|uniref:Uncharacterized protein n=1 Tax=Tagetes erecta TaxID=13708 RepID=A0AAD8KVE4_TARER|nr:hypothetical protein QVD17_11966 [Tagetes erecta]
MILNSSTMTRALTVENAFLVQDGHKQEDEEEMTKALESEKLAYAATQVDITKVKSSKVILAKLISEWKDNKAGLGFAHEPMPESITNTLLENFNPLDHSPESKEKFKEFKDLNLEARKEKMMEIV